MPKTWAINVLMLLDFLSVVGMLNGATAGIGMVHALYCDIRFAADNAVFTTSFARRGLIAEHGLSWMLPMVVGHPMPWICACLRARCWPQRPRPWAW
jgi:enoyl-CoA hydratase/carnithine racemase